MSSARSWPADSATTAWLKTIDNIVNIGNEVAPRGLLTRELPQHTVAVDLTRPLVAVPARKLSTRFAAAEALWILAGDNRVEELARYVPRMRAFSDDGVTLAGAYGPEVHRQFAYVVAKLLVDRDTRQAVLTMWKPNPPPSKDVPCTVGLAFQIRDDALNCHAFMRSSDAWLGLPYDVFSFALIATAVACEVNERLYDGHEPIRSLGTLYLTAASSHLYATNFADVELCLTADPAPSPTLPPLFEADGALNTWGGVFAPGLVRMREDGAPWGWS